MINSPIIPPKKACKWGNCLKNRVSWIWREPFRLACKWKPRYVNPRYMGTRCTCCYCLDVAIDNQYLWPKSAPSQNQQRVLAQNLGYCGTHSRNIELFNAISESVWTHCLESINNIRIVFEQLRKWWLSVIDYWQLNATFR